ncbi:CDP-alcohol phosphatidyltransferase family protein [Rhodospirillum rubrum]|uniref:CDP-diacylglycerol--glycerol-3-phosphate 3-phosphatidyltransferase n=1 Tax=Rhodospirillum rubrum (strain ATCC 11170 / ATH 1.1.1 / DSM 467 / LMG 4362 / NCIMB 8255 / S1) TaxID=269796 RepID=Q2RSD0_RHORT|nr:CDP-alcohol phosphatidyltransferase family protein [Rhodospirillum rubrum]ABC22965.1 CDP-alcohol phosphatidyltransferase [Rhodospirillum rubrum ATCC 11170]AEO48695.1 CDP-alcohol phosphatidyltransferase [Rhodospirillum rubrum F11]MBK5954590.1 CDP-alcohol phosphatidyltransferase [Rhodospirillum rubrum]QXG78951.1 CDP-alcohol phosphatidyltransferase family protein [Rhodospirillum rubrum]HAP98845.1 CDP-alcohol phosphatidyltransferase family protein [Rhodospirillum rubrum]
MTSLRRRCIRQVPNTLTVGRFALVPVAAGFIWTGDLRAAFWVFVAAGITDALDGWLARVLDARTALGATLDPLADKALLVATFFTLALTGAIPLWLLGLVALRDALILAGFAWLRLRAGRPIRVTPNILGKANTLAQILLCAAVIGASAFTLDLSAVIAVLTPVVAATTIISGIAYLRMWLRRGWDGQQAHDRIERTRRNNQQRDDR